MKVKDKGILQQEHERLLEAFISKIREGCITIVKQDNCIIQFNTMERKHLLMDKGEDNYGKQ